MGSIQSGLSLAVMVALAFSPKAFSEVRGRPVQGLPQECQSFLDTTVVDHGWQAEFIDVPLDWSHPQTSAKVKVLYYFNGDRDLKAATPILFLNGGPFSSYHNRLDAIDKMIQKYDTAKNHVFVMMDQRGTGCSVPLMPPVLDQIVPETLPLFASTGVVQDAEEIRKRLFPNKKWKVYGQSYGGELTARYLSLFPDSVSEVHLYAPGYFTSMEQFFYLRIKKQNDVLETFFEHYNDSKNPDFLRSALQKMKGSSGNSYCLEATPDSPKVCGQPLLDALLASVGQGSGRYLKSTELWDGLRDALIELGRSTPDPAEIHHQKFMAAVTASTGFFHLVTNVMVGVIWAQETKTINVDNGSDCDSAYEHLMKDGISIPELQLDECRIIKNLIPQKYKDFEIAHAAVFQGHNQLTQADTLSVLAKRSIPFFMYTGELDSLVQPESLQELIASPLVSYRHFQDSGHAGWQWQPEVWQQLMDAPIGLRR